MTFNINRERKTEKMRLLLAALTIFLLFSIKAQGAEDPGSIILNRDLEKLKDLVKTNPSLGGEFGPAMAVAPIHQAAIKGWKEGLEILLNGKVDPNLLAKTGETALHYACQEGHADLIRVLIELGASLESRNSTEMSPLHVAAKFGRFPVIETLLQLKADPNARDKEYRTPLHWVSRMGKDVEEESSTYSLDFSLFRKSAQLLLDNGALVNALDDLDNSPLAYARKYNGTSMAFDSLYGVLSRAGGKEAAKDILGKDVFDLFQAIEKGDLKTVSELLEKNPACINIRKGGTTPLHKAAWENKKEIVSLLLDKGVNVDSKKQGSSTALHEAAFRGNIEIIDLLLARGGNIQGFNPEDTPLHKATDMNQTEAMALLLKKGANPNSCAEGGQSPLFAAAREGRLEAAELLIANGANIHQKDRHGHTPLSIARNFSQEEMIKFLESKGATAP